MLNAIFVGIRFVILVLGGHGDVALENVALRQQLGVFKRDKIRPRLHRRDRLFWIALRTLWKNWKSALVIVRPETVISWQQTIQTILVAIVSSKGTGTSANEYGDSKADPNDGYRQSTLGGTASPWGTSQTRL